MTDEDGGSADDGDNQETADLTAPPEWTGPSADPKDEQFGDVVERTTLETAGEHGVVIVGEPYDGAVIGRPGAAEAPAAIRESLAAAKTHHVDVGPVAAGPGRAGGERRGKDGDGHRERGGDGDGGRRGQTHGPAGPDGGIGDLGDVAFPGADAEDSDATELDVDTDAAEFDVDDVAAVQDRVRGVTRAVYESGALPVFLGGDNSLTYPNAAPLLERGSLGVLSFDAHLDCREVRPDEGPTSGTPYRQLYGDGLESLAVLGARHFETSTAYHDYLHERGGRVFTPGEVAAAPVDAMDDAIASLGDVDSIYVSVDLDVLDAAAAPGVSAPTPGGLSTRELYRLLEHVATHGRVAGFEVVECAPPLDRDGRTVDAASRAVAHFLASLAAPKGRHSRRGALDA